MAVHARIGKMCPKIVYRYEDAVQNNGGIVNISKGTYSFEKTSNSQPVNINDYIVIRYNKQGYVFKVIGTIELSKNSAVVPNTVLTDADYWNDKDMLSEAITNGKFYICEYRGVLPSIHNVSGIINEDQVFKLDETIKAMVEKTY